MSYVRYFINFIGYQIDDNSIIAYSLSPIINEITRYHQNEKIPMNASNSENIAVNQKMLQQIDYHGRRYGYWR